MDLPREKKSGTSWASSEEYLPKYFTSSPVIYISSVYTQICTVFILFVFIPQILPETFYSQLLCLHFMYCLLKVLFNLWLFHRMHQKVLFMICLINTSFEHSKILKVWIISTKYGESPGSQCFKRTFLLDTFLLKLLSPKFLSLMYYLFLGIKQIRNNLRWFLKKLLLKIQNWKFYSYITYCFWIFSNVRTTL